MMIDIDAYRSVLRDMEVSVQAYHDSNCIAMTRSRNWSVYELSCMKEKLEILQSQMNETADVLDSLLDTVNSAYDERKDEERSDYQEHFYQGNYV